MLNPENSDLVYETDLEKIYRDHKHRLIRIPECEFFLTMGSDPDCDIYIPCPKKLVKPDKISKHSGLSRILVLSNATEIKIWQSISRRHCRIYNRGRDIRIEDLGSRNGTYVEEFSAAVTNGVLLNDGDRFRLGPYSFRVIYPGENRGLKLRSDFPFEPCDKLLSDYRKIIGNAPTIPNPMKFDDDIPSTEDYKP